MKNNILFVRRFVVVFYITICEYKYIVINLSDSLNISACEGGLNEGTQ